MTKTPAISLELQTTSSYSVWRTCPNEEPQPASGDKTVQVTPCAPLDVPCSQHHQNHRGDKGHSRFKGSIPRATFTIYIKVRLRPATPGPNNASMTNFDQCLARILVRSATHKAPRVSTKYSDTPARGKRAKFQDGRHTGDRQVSTVRALLRIAISTFCCVEDYKHTL